MEAISSWLDNKPLAFILTGLAIPIVLKLLDHYLNRGSSNRADLGQLIESYRKEVERLTTENARLQELVQAKEDEVEDLWQRQRKLRDEVQTLLFKKEMEEEDKH